MLSLQYLVRVLLRQLQAAFAFRVAYISGPRNLIFNVQKGLV
jgi:hypothetical protein